ncbi:uncharacterized protein LOC143029754 isoform X2 [Oratosquilla oratoria]|uniref:uncharacterized protein LOC143029754 isoform X2 n=1 Tax=Oratosquilla oratoria TaxID=337810 RepID=UPI003F7611BA
MRPISTFWFSFLLILVGTIGMPRTRGQEYLPHNHRQPVNNRPVNPRPLNNHPPAANNNPPKGGISEGHRLITRALWRIFDALMQKKEHGELYSRTQEMQSVLKDLVTEDTKLRQQYRTMKDEIELWRSEASTMRKEMEALLGLRQRIESLESWQQTVESQRDQDIRRGPQKGPTRTLEVPSSSSSKHEDSSDTWAAAAAYTSCPLPYELVGNECFHITRGAKRSWMGARRECGELGGDLAAPRDLKALRDYLMRYPDSPEYLWIGASRIQETWSPETQTTHTWAWATGPMAGKPLDMSNSTWNEGLPSGAGNCVGLFNEAHFRAYDYKCSEPDLYVCQFFY